MKAEMLLWVYGGLIASVGRSAVQPIPSISPCSLYRYRILIVVISTLLKNIDIDSDVNMVIFENINIDIGTAILENIDINKAILKNIDIDIDIDRKSLRNIDIDKIMKILIE